MQVLEVQQGSDQWHQARAKHFTASEAPAMMGASKYQTRSELLHQKYTGIAPEVDAAKQRLFDAGHASEAAARPIVEARLGADLYPVTGTLEVEGLPLLASFDGITITDDLTWENKLLSIKLAEQIKNEELEPHYYWQLEHQLLVSGAEKSYFTASDGTEAGTHGMYYESRPERRAALIAGWKQFAADLAAYVPADIKEMPKAEATLALPALFIQAKGEITTSNMKEYGEALARRLSEVRSIALVTDQDFSNAKDSARLLRDNIQQAKLAKDAMLAQTVTVGEAARMIDAWCEDMRVTALKLEQDVEREDKAKKAAMIAKSKSAYEQHIVALTAETGGPWIVLPSPDWASALKNKRNFASMQDALDTMLANAKIAADDSARKIRASLACMAEEGKGYEFLLADRLSHIGKPVDDVRTLVRARITEHKAAEEKRLDAERAAIRAEEERKAQAAVQAERDRIREQEAAAARQRLIDDENARRAAATPTPAPSPAPVMTSAVPATAVRVSPVPAAANDAKISMGELNDRFAPIAFTAAALEQLGFKPVAIERSAKLYREADIPLIAQALIDRLIPLTQELQAA